MLLWVGLGNPEPGMARNRHNIGFMALDMIAIRHGFSRGGSASRDWCPRASSPAKDPGAEAADLYERLGQVGAGGAAFYKLPPETITAFHDELDLVPGKVRVKRGGGAAGHNGLRSMDRMLGTPDYWRVRLGIGHPGDKERVLGHVLGDFVKADRDWLLPLLDAVADAAPLLVRGQARGFHDARSRCWRRGRR